METQTLKMTDYEAPGLRDHINNDPLSRAQDQLVIALFSLEMTM